MFYSMNLTFWLPSIVLYSSQVYPKVFLGLSYPAYVLLFSLSQHSVSVVRERESMQMWEGLRTRKVEKSFWFPRWNVFQSSFERSLPEKYLMKFLKPHTNNFRVSTLTAVFTFGGMFVGGFAVPYLTQVCVLSVRIFQSWKTWVFNRLKTNCKFALTAACSPKAVDNYILPFSSSNPAQLWPFHWSTLHARRSKHFPTSRK